MTTAKSIFISPKTRLLPKGLTHHFGQKCNFFLQLFLFKTRLEIMFNDILDNKETFLHCKKGNFSECQKSHISKGDLTHNFGQQCNFCFQLFSFKTRLEIMFNDILYNINKETFLHCKIKKFFRVPNSAFFRRG